VCLRCDCVCWMCLCVSEAHHCWMVPLRQVTDSQQQKEGGDLIKPKKLPNPDLASHQHRALHHELLFCQRRGLLPRRKPELQCVLEQKRREQHKQRERALRPPSDLEAKLRTRRQRIQVLRNFKSCNNGGDVTEKYNP
ncbi:hypothetical protein L3Q82_025048, partial [Scortum barcoo]